MVVDASADIRFTARKLANVKTQGSGQMCISSDYLLVHDSVKDQLVQGIVEAWKEMFGDDPE